MPLFASDYDKSKYLRAEDLKQEKKFRLKPVTEEVFKNKEGKAEKKLVCWFTNDDRGLVLNKTNNRTIRGAFGDDTSNWPGKIVVLYPVMTDVGGKMTPALRVRIPPPKQATAAPQQQTAPQQPVTSGIGANAPSPTGNGAAAAPLAAAAPAAVDPELAADPVKPIREELDDEIPW